MLDRKGIFFLILPYFLPKSTLQVADRCFTRISRDHAFVARKKRENLNIVYEPFSAPKLLISTVVILNELDGIFK